MTGPMPWEPDGDDDPGDGIAAPWLATWDLETGATVPDPRIGDAVPDREEGPWPD